MTKKDYTLIAKIFRNYLDSPGRSMEESEVKELINRFANELAHENHRFSQARFISEIKRGK